jgi:L-arabinokinase
MTDPAAFVETLQAHAAFERGHEVIVARAPGRLDVMGGIADYSGSLVLQRPIAEATFAAIRLIDRPVLEIISIGRKPCTVPLDRLAPHGEPITYDEARTFFRREPDRHWVAYIGGLFLVLMRERRVSFSQGARIVMASRVPEGKGVSSSAALETAAMQAIVSAFGIPVDAREIALLCQKAENLVAGAPCGVMDQMTCVFGEKDALLALLCQPAELQPEVRVPDELSFWGVDSGERHAVTGSDYVAVRTGAFMGYRIIAGSDAAWNGYLANISPQDFEREFVHRLPDEMLGGEFLARYGATGDKVTTIDASRVYQIRRPASHPVYEHDRVKAFRDLLLAAQRGEQDRMRLGEFMYASHASYSAVGLGSRGTDLIVDLVCAEGAGQGLYGARITGGGSGGTVAVLGRSDAEPAVRRVAQAYEKMMGHQPYIFSGSSSGVARFGSMKVNL